MARTSPEEAAVWAWIRARLEAQREDLERTADAVFQLHCEHPCPAHHRAVTAVYPHPAGPDHGMAAGIACLLEPRP